LLAVADLRSTDPRRDPSGARTRLHRTVPGGGSLALADPLRARAPRGREYGPCRRDAPVRLGNPPRRLIELPRGRRPTTAAHVGLDDLGGARAHLFGVVDLGIPRARHVRLGPFAQPGG